VCFAVGLVLVTLTILGWRAERRKTAEKATLRAGWRAQNLASLMQLSAAKGLSAEEQARLQRAEGDPTQVRQALIEIHELRLAYASHDLEDAQKRKLDLTGRGGYTVYPDEPPQTDLVALANQDEWTATQEIAIYAKALSSIRNWKPESYEQYEESRDRAPVTVAGAGSAAAVPQVRKPAPGTPVQPIHAASSEAREVTAAELPIPSRQEVAEAAQHPTMTVYADAGAGVVDDASVTDRSAEENEIRRTLAQWSHAMVLNDPHAESAAYAPHMERYFLRTNVDRAFVEADKSAYLRRGNLTASFDLQDVRFENETPDAVDVRLIKDVAWAQSSSGATHKLIRSELHLVRTNGGWKIAGERDFR
jgi:hypothetical protein